MMKTKLKIEIPVPEHRAIQEFDVEMPDLCFYCGDKADGTLEQDVSQVYTPKNLDNSITHHEKIDVPYCEDHLKAVQDYETREENFQDKFGKILMAVLAIPLLLVLFMPVFNWVMEGLDWVFASGLFALTVVGIVDLFIVGVLMEVIVGWLYKVINQPPSGLQTKGVRGKIIFKFANEKVAEKFEELN